MSEFTRHEDGVPASRTREPSQHGEAGAQTVLSRTTKGALCGASDRTNRFVVVTRAGRNAPNRMIARDLAASGDLSPLFRTDVHANARHLHECWPLPALRADKGAPNRMFGQSRCAAAQGSALHPP